MKITLKDGSFKEYSEAKRLYTMLSYFKPIEEKKVVVKSEHPLKDTFSDFGSSATAIVRGLATMFKRENWEQMGGIVAIGFETTNTLTNYGLYYFIYIWGMISVNLAIANLIPFPGLDGWQLLVLIVEAIAHKTIPEKVKNIVSFVGIALLFVFMGVILFKDVFKYIFVALL